MVEFVDIKLFIISPHYLFNIERICNNVASLIPSVDNLFLYSVFLSQPGKWFINFIEKNSFVLLISLYCLFILFH